MSKRDYKRIPSLSSLKQRREQFSDLKRKDKAIDEASPSLEEPIKTEEEGTKVETEEEKLTVEQPPTTEETAEDSEGEYNELLDRITDAETRESLERYLKNEAYAFLLSEGLLDKFLEVRIPFHRTRLQESIFTLVLESNSKGLWIDP